MSLTIGGLPPKTLVQITARAFPSVGNITAQCVATNGSCTILFEPFGPSTAYFDVVWDQGGGATMFATRTFIVQPAYKVSQPNGPDCTPICHFATVQVNW